MMKDFQNTETELEKIFYIEYFFYESRGWSILPLQEQILKMQMTLEEKY